MTFLPENYEPPVSAGGNYLKLQPGVNTIRILSKPIIGWEMWVNEHPQRYPYDKKPEAIGDTKVREFWSLVAWNYEQSRIQIYHITQGSIKKAIRDLSQDPDWGSPGDYDLKITKTGQQLKTNYAVTPVPKSPVKPEIKQAYADYPCWLPALFEGEDPFVDGRSTPAIWEVKQDVSKTITEAQYKEIMDYIGDDRGYMSKVVNGLKKSFGVDLKTLPVSLYEKLLKQVKLHSEERARQEMMQTSDDLPF